MPCITTCSQCSKAYEAGSEEQANEPVRICPMCRGHECPQCHGTGKLVEAGFEPGHLTHWWCAYCGGTGKL